MKRIASKVKYETNHHDIHITVMGKNLKHCASKVRRIIKNIDNGYFQNLVDNLPSIY